MVANGLLTEGNGLFSEVGDLFRGYEKQMP
jgi:hypothetical protein